jgi:hypothetical protein
LKSEDGNKTFIDVLINLKEYFCSLKFADENACEIIEIFE